MSHGIRNHNILCCESQRTYKLDCWNEGVNILDESEIVCMLIEELWGI
jgi:hypothetical protein